MEKRIELELRGRQPAEVRRIGGSNDVDNHFNYCVHVVGVGTEFGQLPLHTGCRPN